VSRNSNDSEEGRSALPLLWLAVAPLCSALAALAFPRWHLSEGAAISVATAAATVPAIASMAAASKAAPRPLPFAVLAAAGLAGMAFIYARGVTSAWWLPLATASEVAAGMGVGSLIGSRVEHAGHVLPAAFVAAAADTLSVLHPSGASNAIAHSDRALSALALGAPIPGTDAITFALGVGDLTFAALLFAVAARHGVSTLRVLAAVAIGVLASLLVAAFTGAPIPALVGIGGAAVMLVPQFRQVRRKERAVTQIAIAVSIAVVLGTLGRLFLGGGG